MLNVTFQVYTRAGFYGPEICTNMRTLADLPKKLNEVFDEIPDELEGERFADWINIDVRIKRT